ncbi:hypothetical protein D3C80_2041090 [compost metagenome]
MAYCCLDSLAVPCGRLDIREGGGAAFQSKSQRSYERCSEFGAGHILAGMECTVLGSVQDHT